MFRRTTELDISVDDGQLVIDGAVLEDVLAEVYRRYGPDARIVTAERTVVGGVGGFFGTERFHVVARPADGEEEPARLDDEPAQPLDGPSFAAALAEALSSNEIAHEMEPSEPLEPAELSEPTAAAVVPQPLAAPVPDPVAPLPSWPSAPVPSMQPPPFVQPAPPAQTPPTWSPHASSLPAPALPAPSLPTPTLPASSLPTAPAPSARLRPPAWPPAPSRVGPTASLPAITNTRDLPPLPPFGDPTADAGVPRSDDPTSGPTAAALPSPPADPEQLGTGPITAAELLSVAELPIDDLLCYMDLLVPEPVPPAPDGVVAIVGDAEDAVTTARRLAAREGTPDSSVVVLLAPDLSSRDTSRVVITSLPLIDQQRRRWSMRRGTTFVAVALGPGDAGRAWTLEALRVLAPTQVRYAAPAWRSGEELRDRVAAIGHVDCVDLVDLQQAVEPTEFLALQPPIATIEGRPVSPELWAAHLMATRRTSMDTQRHDIGGNE
jgi:hypothetical protein